MKVLNEGKVPEPPKPWWIGKSIRCQCCGFRGQLEEGDLNTEWNNESKFVECSSVNLPCPTCGKTMILAKPIRFFPENVTWAALPTRNST